MKVLDDFDRIETGFAVLYLGDSIVYKLRKPATVRAGSETRDLSGIDARHAACKQEEALNAVLAPDVEAQTVPVVRRPDSRIEVAPPGERVEGEVIDWALRMCRLPDSDRADRRLASGTLDDARLELVAHRLATFHEHARGSASPANPVERLRGQIALTPTSANGSPESRVPLPPEVSKIERWQSDYLERNREQFARRAKSDSIRHGHGELGLDHVFVNDAGDVQVLAGLEMMGSELRNADVVADVALLSSDLAAHRRADLAERFVAAYAYAANDFDLYPLLDFYASLRAAQRGKLDWLTAERHQAASPNNARAAERYRERARAFFKLALAAPRRPLLPPTVVAMGGQVASGKSTVAKHIGKRIGAPVVSSDATRDHLLGSRLNEDLHEVHWERAYEDGFGERVYGEVLRRASEVLGSGRPVVIDGCFRSREQRERARELAQRFEHPFLFVEASVSREVQLARLGERAVRDAVGIEVWTDIADELRAQWQPADHLPRDEHLRLDTAHPLDTNADAIEARLATWPEDLVG
ncbi:MAG: AAA family ATPase [Myxococcota bacterium]|jgi:hypothetical protein|nr:AAA family ATPase [Myxococcota bacterium]